MNQSDYDALTRLLLGSAANIEHAKRPGYTLGDDDVLHNFKSVAARAGISPGQAWATYFLKHVDAIMSVMARPDLPVAEAPLGRFSDAINYLKLGYALLNDDSLTTTGKSVPSSPSVDAAGGSGT